MDYWKNKELRAEKAKNHTQEMQAKYPKKTQLSINLTNIWDDNRYRVERTELHVPKIILTTHDTVSAILKYRQDNTAALNFASYKNPGGMFYKGSCAQEESLCHESNLYNVLSAFEKNYYEWNRGHLNRALYLNRALVTPGVVFQREPDDPVECTIITCAAPNFTAANKYQHVTREENNKVLFDRINFIYSIVENYKFNTVIFGAFGCGVFGQDPFIVAEYFKKLFNNSVANQIIYAIPPGPNYNAFKQVFFTNN